MRSPCERTDVTDPVGVRIFGLVFCVPACLEPPNVTLQRTTCGVVSSKLTDIRLRDAAACLVQRGILCNTRPVASLHREATT